MSDSLTIQSHRGPYTVVFDPGVPGPSDFGEGTVHVLLDANVSRLYEAVLGPLHGGPRTIVIEATEPNKSIERTIPIFEQLVANGIRRDHLLVAVGGGIVQDICCFIASTLLRGLPWRFLPTTLLAQADSCIGSKSSINLGATKNILGTFNPPQTVSVFAGFLETLEPKDVHSGIGEILKVHAIDGRASFDQVAADFDGMLTDRAVLQHYVREALRIKQRFIEADEFDRGVRNVFNYGHSFGHAIESAVDYRIPHGIAVSMGMDMANHISAARGLTPSRHATRMHPVLRRNYEAFRHVAIPAPALLSALLKDKKNTATMLGLILPVGEEARIERVSVPLDDAFREQCQTFLARLTPE